MAASVAIRGSAGSVGTSTLDLLAQARAHGLGDVERFPAIVLARAALRSGGLAPAAMSAANEPAVAAFLDRRTGFLDIAAKVAETLERMERTGDLRAEANANGPTETAMAADRCAPAVAAGVLAELEPSL